jgi:lycopene cyclase domain-containing protein
MRGSFSRDTGAGASTRSRGWGITSTVLAAGGLSLPALTYAEFHLVFILPVLAGLAVLASYPLGGRPYAAPAGIGVLLAVAVLYTTPWDNHLIEVGVWGYAEGSVLFRIWYAPIEEYLFFVLQPLITAFWLCRLPAVTDPDPIGDRDFGIPLGHHALGLLGGGLVSGAGWLLVDQYYYLGTLLLWAGPPLAIQWAFAWPVLWDLRRTLAVGILVPTVYLWIVDRIAIAMGIWFFDPAFMTGIAVLGLPIEEMLFFLLTNVFVVQGLLLFWWVTDRWPAVQARWQGLTDRSGPAVEDR